MLVSESPPNPVLAPESMRMGMTRGKCCRGHLRGFLRASRLFYCALSRIVEMRHCRHPRLVIWVIPTPERKQKSNIAYETENNTYEIKGSDVRVRRCTRRQGSQSSSKIASSRCSVVGGMSNSQNPCRSGFRGSSNDQMDK